MASSLTTDVLGKPPLVPADGNGVLAPVARDDQPTVISSLPPIVPHEQGIGSDHLLPGDRLEHFEVVELIGGGGMARVYRALDTRLSRPVALKVLTREQAADPDTRQRFQNEAQSTAQLDHDNIARVHYVGEDRGLPFIVFELIQGTDIRAIVGQRGPLPVAEAVSYTLQVAEALSHAAGRNVVHRDIKPSNILITPEGRAKLIDMGLARMHKGHLQGSDLTASGVTLGTFDYISPEQARDPRNADVRSDIYSLGCAFFFMLVGRPPFPDGTVLQKLLQHQGDEPPDPREWRPALPDEVIRVLRKMLAKDPRRRYQDAAELVADLLALAELLGLQPSGAGRTVWITPRETRLSYLERHLPWIAPITALVCTVLVLDFLWAPPRGSDQGPASSSANRDGETGAKPLAPGSSVVAEDSSTTRGPDGSSTRGPVSAGNEPSARPATKPASTGDPQALAPSSSSPGETAKPTPGHDPPSAAPKTTPGSVQPGLLPDDFRGSIAASDPFGSGVTGGKTESPADAAVAPSSRESRPDSQPTPRSERPGVLVVTDKPEGASAFSSLAAACAAAKSGDVIELRYNGPRDGLPVRLADVNLTIRAGEGFRPEIVFRPTAEDKDPVTYPRSMVTLVGGELMLVNVALELNVPADVAAENWSLFKPGPGQTVRLTQCVLTIRNAREQRTATHPDVAFFRVSADTVTADELAPASPPAAIEIVNSIVRGEASLVRIADAQPVRLTWDNGFLAISERLLWADGSQRPPAQGARIQSDLQHLTAAVEGGLCRLGGSDAAPYQLETEFRCRDSILVTGVKSPLIDQTGPKPADALKRLLRWTGEWNFYEGCAVLWSVRAGDDAPAERMDFEAWQAHWGSQREVFPKVGQVAWRQVPSAARPFHALTPVDYTLADPPGGNPARQAARDGRDVGCQIDQLPPAPAASPASGPPARASSPGAN